MGGLAPTEVGACGVIFHDSLGSRKRGIALVVAITMAVCAIVLKYRLLVLYWQMESWTKRLELIPVNEVYLGEAPEV